MDALLNKIEIYFWDRITPALSDSPLFQTIVRKIYNLVHSADFESTLLWGIAAAVFGLLSGVILSILAAAS